ncbi:MAG: HNH endonuclease [Chloroflexi bacterium]|nr:HNH endonuclease [Chloroflexota bacterium]MBV9602087.1 HNH endonuclease [Chloroflexota bacterium]
MARRHSAAYTAYLGSERWRLLRADVIRRAGYRCSACGRGGRLDVHHARGYRNLGNERPEELQALCRTCHEAIHARRQMVNAGCLKVLLWVVMFAIAVQVIVSLMHGVGIS